MIPHSKIPNKLLETIRPTAIRNFLLNSNFELTGKKGDMAEAYSLDGNIVILPIKQDIQYVNQLISLLENVSHLISLPVDDVYGLIVNPNSDIFRYKIESEESRYGSLGADEIKLVTNSLYNIFLSSAQNVAKIRHHQKVRESAGNYAGACRFGQTEYGSFVLKVFCPTNDFGFRSEYSEPFSREVTRSVVENFHFLSTNEVEDPSVPLPPAMSKNVVRSIKEMSPSSPLMFSAGLSVRYAPLKDPSNVKKETEYSKIESSELNFKSFLFDKAAQLYNRYVKADKFGSEILKGYITDLHKDPPTEKKTENIEIIHQITMELRFGNSKRKVTTKLLSSEYRKAIGWHDSGVELILNAKIDKRSKKWTVHELYDLSPVKGQDKLLF